MSMQLTKLQKAKSRMLLQHPFFATLLLSSPLIEDRTIPTAATDMRSIFYNPDFFAELTVEQIMFVLAHEVMHIALEHGLRGRGRNPLLWNVSGDYAINLTLQKTGFELVDGVLCDAKWQGMSAEVIYEKLRDEREQRRKQGQGQGSDPQGKGSQQPGQGSEQGQGTTMPGTGDYADALGPDLRPVPGGGPEDEAETRRSIQQRVAQAASMARMAGKLSGDLERLVNELLNPVVPWQELLRDYMMRVVHDAESWSRRNRRIRSFFFPARHSEKLGKVGIIGDTSGSIKDVELQRTATEVASLAEVLRPEHIVMMWADSRVKRVEELEEGDEVALHPVGGGGTNMVVPLAAMEEYDCEVVVLITDGHTPWPKAEPSYPLIVLCTTDQPVPIGQVVRL